MALRVFLALALTFLPPLSPAHQPITSSSYFRDDFNTFLVTHVTLFGRERTARNNTYQEKRLIASIQLRFKGKTSENTKLIQQGSALPL